MNANLIAALKIAAVGPLEHVPKKLRDFFDIKTSDIFDVS